MSVDWPTISLSEIYEISSGLSKPASAFGSGYPFLSFKEVFGNYFLPDSLTQLVESTEKEREKGSIKRGDVFLTRTSETMEELGMSSVALKDYPDATFNGFSKRLRPNEESTYEVHPEFIGYCLRSPMFRRGMLAFSTMSTRASLNNDMIKRLEINLPPLDIQIEISKILKSLDDKIELNRQTNQTLENIAQAIFKSWFVDFEPTRAKIAATAIRDKTLAVELKDADNNPLAAAKLAADQAGLCANEALLEVIAKGEPELASMASISGKSPAQLAKLDKTNQEQLKTTAALFPDALVDSELGEIPAGFEVKPLADLIQLIGGGTPKRSEDDYWNGNIPWFSVKDAPNESDVFVIDTEEKVTELGVEKSSTKLLPVGTTIITARGTVGKLALVATPMCMNQSCYGVRGIEGIGPYFNYFSLREAISTLHRNTHGAVFDTITTKTFETYSTPIKIGKLTDKFELAVAPILERIESNNRENIKLERLRDTLLPKLLSGELTVNTP